MWSWAQVDKLPGKLTWSWRESALMSVYVDDGIERGIKWGNIHFMVPVSSNIIGKLIWWEGILTECQRISRKSYF